MNKWRGQSKKKKKRKGEKGNDKENEVHIEFQESYQVEEGVLFYTAATLTERIKSEWVDVLHPATRLGKKTDIVQIWTGLFIIYSTS